MLINNNCDGFLVMDCGEFIGKLRVYMRIVMPQPVQNNYGMTIGSHFINLENIINIRKNQGFINEFDGKLFFAEMRGITYYFININNRLVCLTDMKTYFVPHLERNSKEISLIAKIPELGIYSYVLKTYPLV